MASSGNTWFKKLQAKQRRNMLRAMGVKKPFAVDAEQNTNVVKVREYLAPFKYATIKPRRGRCVLRHETRLAILEKAEARVAMRRELFGV